MIEQRMNYIHENPVRAGIVANAEDYLSSSARSYAEMDSIMEIDRVDGICSECYLNSPQRSKNYAE